MEAIQAYCLSCKAEPNQPCRNRQGRPLPKTHPKRVDLTLLDRCDWCGAPTGEPCLGERGGVLRWPHLLRRALGQEVF